MPPPIRPETHRWKRPLDVVLGSTLLVASSPVQVLVSLLIRLDSPGPILFRQERIGRGGVPFTMFKFRSMYDRSSDEHHRHAVAAWLAGTPSSPGGYKSEYDPRITRMGKVIRTLSIDELPQLINVVKGDMSLVGPRPSMAYEREKYEEWYFERETVRPGITGLWQVSGRARLSAPEMIALDVEYVRRSSLLLDLKILAKTLPAMIERRS